MQCILIFLSILSMHIFLSIFLSILSMHMLKLTTALNAKFVSRSMVPCYNIHILLFMLPSFSVPCHDIHTSWSSFFFSPLFQYTQPAGGHAYIFTPLLRNTHILLFWSCLYSQAVIRASLSNGGVAASDVRMLEMHGTGTALGDPIVSCVSFAS